LGAIFFAASLWHYSQVQRYFDPPALELPEQIKRLDAAGAIANAQEYRDWYVRAVLEEMALKRRYQQNNAAVAARVWTRLMGFLTGMVLVFSGCLFILGKMQEQVQVSGEAQGAKWALVTSSPGIVLALAGSALIGIATYIPVTVESTDSAVYLPVLAYVPAARKPPASIDPPAQVAPGQGKTQTPLPSDVERMLNEEAAKAKERPGK
jgi:hypothetical protein